MKSLVTQNSMVFYRLLYEIPCDSKSVVTPCDSFIKSLVTQSLENKWMANALKTSGWPMLMILAEANAYDTSRGQYLRGMSLVL